MVYPDRTNNPTSPEFDPGCLFYVIALSTVLTRPITIIHQSSSIHIYSGFHLHGQYYYSFPSGNAMDECSAVVLDT